MKERDYCPAVSYGPGKIVYIGGGTDAGTGRPTDVAEIIDVFAPTPDWVRTDPMAFPRRQHNATLLADGTVLVTGGTRGDGFNDLDAGQPVHQAEIWDPASGQWSDAGGGAGRPVLPRDRGAAAGRDRTERRRWGVLPERERTRGEPAARTPTPTLRSSPRPISSADPGRRSSPRPRPSITARCLSSTLTSRTRSRRSPGCGCPPSPTRSTRVSSSTWDSGARGGPADRDRARPDPANARRATT